MAEPGTADICDVLIVNGIDGREWCQYLKDLFHTSYQVRNQHILSYEVDSNDTFNSEDLYLFQRSKCIVILLSQDLVNSFSNTNLIRNLQKALLPPQKVVVLFCGITNCEDFAYFFKDWSQWKHISCDDDADVYIAAVKEAILEDSGCESYTDTEAEAEENLFYSKEIKSIQGPSAVESPPSNLLTVLPGRIHCGEKTRLYIIFRCKLDSQVNTEVEFNLTNLPSCRIPATLENEYTISLDAPDLPSGLVSLNVYCDDSVICTGQISYYTDMEEIRSLLENATNPVEFMCQAFKIVPYNIETLDKLLTESLKNNIPASGLHLFGVHQIEEEDIFSANQRNDELPTLLHFAAKYGLKKLTVLLLTCPGALQAYSVCNKHGDFPNGLAEKHGFKDLRQFMDDYVETVGMLKSHIKEEMMQEEDDDDSIYEPMADASTDLLMKCSLNPGCNEDLYESMVGLTPQYASEDLYVQMIKSESSCSVPPEAFSLSSKESVICKFLKDSRLGVPILEGETARLDEVAGSHDFVKKDFPPEVTKRPPVPFPRPESSSYSEEKELYISKVFAEKTGQKRQENIYSHSGLAQEEVGSISREDRSSSSTYDPFAGMKTPGQRQLITLQEQVKSGMISVDEAVLKFKEWHLNQKRRSESFKYQQENLQRLRDSITRRQRERRKKGKSSDLQITKPIKHSQDLPPKVECDVYEYYPVQSIDLPKKAFQRRTWNTESSSSTASSASNRSSTRSTLSFSSGVEGDSEDNEIPDPRSSQRGAILPTPRPPRIPPRNPTRSQSDNFQPPPVPPRGR